MEENIMKLATRSVLELHALLTTLNDENKFDTDVTSEKGIHKIKIRIKGESSEEIENLRRDIQFSLSSMGFNNINKE